MAQVIYKKCEACNGAGKLNKKGKPKCPRCDNGHIEWGKIETTKVKK